MDIDARIQHEISGLKCGSALGPSDPGPLLLAPEALPRRFDLGLLGQAHQLSHGHDIELAHDLTTVGLDRAFGDAQGQGDLFVQHAGDEPSECFIFP